MPNVSGFPEGSGWGDRASLERRFCLESVGTIKVGTAYSAHVISARSLFKYLAGPHKVEAGGYLLVRGQPGLPSEALSQNRSVIHV